MEDSIWPVIKWVLIIMLAGFIGQFGKILADDIVARARSKKKQEPPSGTDPASPPIITEKNTQPESATKSPSPTDETYIKTDKKAAKTMAKLMKKAGKK